MKFFNPLGYEEPKVTSPSSKKRNKFYNKLNNILEDVQVEKQMEEDLNSIDHEERVEELTESFKNPRKNMTRKMRRQYNLLHERVKKELLIGYLTEMTIKGLILDEEFIDLNKESLRESIGDLYTKCFRENIITEDTFKTSPSQLMQYVPLYMEDMATTILSDPYGNTSMETQYTYLESDETEATQTAEEIAELVKEKVLDTLEKEKEIAEKNKEENTTSDEDENVEDQEDLGVMSDQKEDNVEEESLSDEDEEMEVSDGQTEQEPEMSDIENDISDSSQQVITIKTDSPNFEVTSSNGEQDVVVNEGMSRVILESLNLVGKQKHKAYKEEKTLFRGLLESNLTNYALNESTNNEINMDFVLADTITTYTVLETLNTSRLLEMKPATIKSMTLMLRD